MRQFLILTAFLVLAAPLLRASAAAQAPQTGPYPPGPGRDVVALACSQCHQAQPIIQLRMSEDGWRRQIENMILRGAQIGPNDIDAAASYLAANFGPGVPFPNRPAVAMQLPDGPGENLVEGGCGICHGLDRVVATNRPGQQWNAIVHRMVAIGAPFDAEQTNQIITYLAAHYAGAPAGAAAQSQ